MSGEHRPGMTARQLATEADHLRTEAAHLHECAARVHRWPRPPDEFEAYVEDDGYVPGTYAMDLAWDEDEGRYNPGTLRHEATWRERRARALELRAARLAAVEVAEHLRSVPYVVDEVRAMRRSVYGELLANRARTTP